MLKYCRHFHTPGRHPRPTPKAYTHGRHAELGYTFQTFIFHPSSPTKNNTHFQTPFLKVSASILGGFFINFRCFFWSAFFSPSNRNFFEKVTQRDPKREPKGAPKPPKSTLLDLTKHMVFTVWITHWEVWGELGEQVFSTLLSGHRFLLRCSRFL